MHKGRLDHHGMEIGTKVISQDRKLIPYVHPLPRLMSSRYGYHG